MNVHIARSERNKPSMLALHAVNDTGHLYDPDTVEFRVMDLSTGAEVQVFPVSGYQDVSTDGAIDVGVYYATQATGVGWTPDVSENVGRHRIDWRFSEDGEPATLREWSLEFDVSAVGTGLGYWSYLSPQRVRDEGISESDISNERLVELIKLAQQNIERQCRQPFRPVRYTLQIDGSGGTAWLLPIPAVGIEYLKMNGSETAIDSDDYSLHFYPSLGTDPGWIPNDPRKNPKIVLATGGEASIFRAGQLFGSSRGTPRFRAGSKAHSVKGVWGFLEADGTTPLLIQRAMMIMISATAEQIEPGIPPFVVGGPVVRERTDAHEIEFGRPSSGSNLSNPLAYTIEVQEILRAYRAPIGLSSPATMWSGDRIP